MRRYQLILALLVLSAGGLNACLSDEVSNPLPTDGDTTQQQDMTTPDDVSSPVDTTTVEDTPTPEDSASPQDISPMDDITLLEDTTPLEDVMVPEDTAMVEDAMTPEDVSEMDAEPIGLGSSATSCGAVEQGLTPVDCTAYGDTNAFCVFSNHCACSMEDGFVCEGWKEGDGSECTPGLVCVAKTPPVDPMEVGHVATSCGASDQGLTPIDCTQYGDKNAVCVFSNHCMCSTEDGFACETAGQWGDKECDPGVYCKPKD